MKRIILVFVLLVSLACMSLPPTPNDFPSPPTTVIVEFPNVTPTTTLEPRLAPVTPDKMPEAQSFLLMLVTFAAAGDSSSIAEMVKYPIHVNLDGPTTIESAKDFEINYERIFNERILDALMDTSEADLTLMPDGIRVGQGQLWLNLYCVDLPCSDTQFFITQINN